MLEINMAEGDSLYVSGGESMSGSRRHNVSMMSTSYPDSAGNLKGWELIKQMAEHGINEAKSLIYIRARKQDEVNMEDPHDEDTDNPLHLAAEKGYIDILVALRRVEEIHVNDYNQLGQTALHLAATYGQVQAVECLLDGHARIDHEDRYGQTAAMMAVQKGHNSTVEILIKRGASLQHVDSSGKTLLHHAARHQHKSIVKMLLEKGADPNVEDKDHFSPLHSASAHGHSEVTRILLENGARADFQDAEGRIPLHHAAAGGYADVVSVLIHYHDGVRDEDKFKFTPHDLAQLAGFQQVAEMLIPSSNEDNLLLQESFRLSFDAVPKPVLNEGEVMEIYACVQKLVENLCLSALGSQILVRLVGSAYEGTRVGLPDECDFLCADLTVNCLPVKPSVPDLDAAYMELQCENETDAWYRSAIIRDGNRCLLSSTLFHKAFRDCLKEYIMKLDTVTSRTGKLRVQENLGQNYLNQAAACPMNLIWEGNEDSKYKYLTISVDMNPCIRIQGWSEDAVDLNRIMPGMRWDQWFEGEEPHYFMVAKPPSRFSELGNRLSPEELRLLWRVDFAHVESRVMGSLPQSIKDVYLKAKSLRDSMPALKDSDTNEHFYVKDHLRSYFFKTAVLQLAKSHFLSSDGITLGEMVVKVFEEVELYMSLQILPSFVHPNVNELVGSKLDPPKIHKSAKYASRYVKKFYPQEIETMAMHHPLRQFVADYHLSTRNRDNGDAPSIEAICS